MALLLVCYSSQQDTAPAPSATSLVIENGARFTNHRTVTLNIRFAESDPKPVEMALSSDGAHWSPWRPFAATSTFDLPGDDGEKTVHVRFSDASGSEIPAVHAAIILDTTPPKAEVTAPPTVPSGPVTLMSNVPDAVAMQFTEDPDHWGPWEPYARPKAFLLSEGEGYRTILVRYRDEAGNVSAIARVAVAVKQDSTPDLGPRLQDIQIVEVKPKEDSLTLRIAIRARGMAESEIGIDGAVVQSRSDFSSTLDLAVPRTGLSHRISMKFWDDAQNEFTAELAFLERELPIRVPPAQEEPAFEARLSAGAWRNGLDFDAATPVGHRRLQSGTMGVIQLSLGWRLLDPAFVEASGEVDLGKDATITTFGVDLGAILYRGPLLIGDGDVRVQGGFLLSSLKVQENGFGNFDLGTGYRAGVSAQTALSARLSLDASVQYRSLSYKWSEAVLSGDTRASAAGGAALLGLTLKF